MLIAACIDAFIAIECMSFASCKGCSPSGRAQLRHEQERTGNIYQLEYMVRTGDTLRIGSYVRLSDTSAHVYQVRKNALLHYLRQ